MTAGPLTGYLAERDELVATATPGTHAARSLADLTDRVVSALAGAALPALRTALGDSDAGVVDAAARAIAALQEVIGRYGVPAIFTESTVSAKLAQQVAADTGARLVPLYTGSLGGPGSGAETYVELMRYDVTAIVEALR